MSEEKDYPSNFPPDAVSILNSMSFHPNNLTIAGSAGLRSMLYAGDYDGFEVVKAPSIQWIVKRFQSIVQGLSERKDLFIGDIKCGSIDEWDIFAGTYTDGKKVYGYNASAIREKRDSVPSLTNEEKNYPILDNPSPEQYVQAKDILKFAAVRWSVPAVLKGYTTLRDGTRFTLEEGIHSRTKLDTVGYVENNRWTDFSVIYQFEVDGTTLNPEKGNAKRDIYEDVIYYKSVGNNFKALKRIYSLAVLKGDMARAKELIPVFNSDLGRLYRIISDIHTLIYLLENENAPLRSVQFEIGQFIGRLSNIYTLKDYLKEEHSILNQINSALRSSKSGLPKKLLEVAEHLEEILNRHSEKYL